MGGRPDLGRRRAADAGDAFAARPLEQPVRLGLDPAGDVGVGRAAVGRVVLEPAVVGRVVRRRDDDPVGQPAAGGRRGVGSGDRPAPVRDEDRVGDGRRRRHAERVGGDADVDPVRREHLERRRGRRLAQGVGVPSEEQRAVVAAARRDSGRSPR